MQQGQRKVSSRLPARVGFVAATSLFVAAVTYMLVVAYGVARVGFDEPITDPILGVMEVLQGKVPLARLNWLPGGKSVWHTQIVTLKFACQYTPGQCLVRWSVSISKTPTREHASLPTG